MNIREIDEAIKASHRARFLKLWVGDGYVTFPIKRSGEKGRARQILEDLELDPWALVIIGVGVLILLLTD